MGFNPALRKEVRKLANDEKGKLSETEIYKSPELQSYLERLSASLMEGEKTASVINVFKGEREGPIAWTNGNTVNINWNNEIVWYFPTPEQRFVAFMGLFFHEKAHDLYCDFNEEKRALDYLGKGLFYGDAPRNLSTEENADWADMQAAMANPVAREIFQQVFSELSNIVDDAHDENALIDVYGSFVGEGIYLCQSALHASCTLFEDMKDELLAGTQSELTIAYNLLLQTTRFGYALSRDPSVLDNSQFGVMLKSVSHHAEIACATDDLQRRFAELNYIILALWPFIRSQLQQNPQQGQGQQGQQGQGQQNSQDPNGGQGQGDPNSQNQQSQANGQQQNSQSGGQNSQQSQGSIGNATQEQIQQILDQLKKGAQNAGQTQAPEGKKSSGQAIQRRAEERKGEKKEAREGEQQRGGQKSSSEAIYAAIEGLQQKIAERKAEDAMEKEAKKSMIDAVIACDQTSPHKAIPLRFERVLQVSPKDVARYEREMKDLSRISKRLQRQIIDALRDLKEGYVARHKLVGKDIVASDAYRPDGRMFANKKQPQDLPDMAISVLVDHSGSMSSEERIQTAMRASMLLYDFATGIDIPISISGHRSSDGSQVDYITYTDFEKISDKDRYRLAKMTASGNNRDGMALNIAAGLLEKRPEQVKLLIIISDGRPNHYNYGGKAAQQDIQQIVRNCKRKGIEVIAAAIGTDRKQIQDIYKDAFLDISDLAKLPKIMTNIVRKRVLRNAL